MKVDFTLDLKGEELFVHSSKQCTCMKKEKNKTNEGKHIKKSFPKIYKFEYVRM